MPGDNQPVPQIERHKTAIAHRGLSHQVRLALTTNKPAMPLANGSSVWASPVWSLPTGKGAHLASSQCLLRPRLGTGKTGHVAESWCAAKKKSQPWSICRWFSACV